MHSIYLKRLSAGTSRAHPPRHLLLIRLFSDSPSAVTYPDRLESTFSYTHIHLLTTYTSYAIVICNDSPLESPLLFVLLISTCLYWAPAPLALTYLVTACLIRRVPLISVDSSKIISRIIITPHLIVIFTCIAMHPLNFSQYHAIEKKLSGVTSIVSSIQVCLTNNAMYDK